MERQLGEVIGVSIGSAIALEGILTGTVPVNDYSKIYINLKTLHRNYFGTFKAIDMPPLKAYKSEFFKELTKIQSIITETLPGNLQPVFYLCTHKTIINQMPYAKIKTKFTDKQNNFLELEKLCLENIKLLNKLAILPQVFDTLINGYKTRSLILTHHPVDLLSAHTFRELILLESHTGTTKDKLHWFSKLSKKEDYQNIPFNPLTLQLFGDNNNLLESESHKMIKAFMAIATTNRWNRMTNIEKMKLDIRKINDKAFSQYLIAMSSINLK